MGKMLFSVAWADSDPARALKIIFCEFSTCIKIYRTVGFDGQPAVRQGKELRDEEIESDQIWEGTKDHKITYSGRAGKSGDRGRRRGSLV